MNIFKNRNSRKTIILGIIVIMLSTGIFWVINNIQYRKYLKIVNAKIDNIISQVIEKYPDITEEEVLEILKNNETPESSVLEKYGYTPDISYIKTLGEQIETNKKQNIALVIIFGTVSLGIYLIYVITQEKKIAEINEYIKQINNKNYILKIEENDNGELSKLRNELYKTTVLLKETAEISEKEKENLSTAIADISHQLKTPLTAMRLMISSIRKLEGSGEDEVRQRARRLTEMQQLVDRVDSLVVVLLKMAKLDSGTAILQKERISIKELILHSAEPLAISMDLHGVKLCLNGNDTDSFQGDFGWSAEAITNILKNGIEHMENGGNLYVSWSEKSVYSEIEIEDEGSGISDEELPHIFERFYRGKTARHSGFGIGMAMAQSIFAKQNGTIKAQNREEGGAKFIIHVRK